MTTLGLGFMLKGAVTMAPGWGAETHALPTPFAGQVLVPGGVPIAADHLGVIAVTAFLGIALFAFFRFTRLGKALRATAQNPLGARLVGIPLARMHGLIWALAAGLAAVAGVLLAPVTFVHAHMGVIGLKALPAAVIGGFGSIPGAVVGGLLLGLVESFAGFYAPDGVKDSAAHVLVLAVQPAARRRSAAGRRRTDAAARIHLGGRAGDSACPGVAVTPGLSQLTLSPSTSSPVPASLLAAMRGSCRFVMRHSLASAPMPRRSCRRAAGRWRFRCPPWPPSRDCPAWRRPGRRAGWRASIWPSPPCPSVSSFRKCWRAGTR
jgi:hypothetical protein